MELHRVSPKRLAVELVVGALAHGASAEDDDVRLRAVRDRGIVRLVEQAAMRSGSYRFIWRP